MKQHEYDREKIEARVHYAGLEKINHFSPTISPAPKDKDRNEIESLYKALLYYKNHGITNVLVQPKYMGSYCDIYLNKNLAETKFVSRNGYYISRRNLNKDDLFEAVKPLHEKMFNLYPNAEIILIQSELLPWSILGANLIEYDFLSYLYTQKTHLNLLKNSSLLGKLEKIKNQPLYKQYINDVTSLSREELIKKYKHHIVRQYESIDSVIIYNLNDKEKSINIFDEQLDIFSTQGKPYFKPFSILKIVNTDGTEINTRTIDTFSIVSDDIQCSLDLNNFDNSVDLAYKYYNSLVSENMEGVMVKALNQMQAIDHEIPGCFKVRNNKYLTLVYGLDFNLNYDNIFEKRSINSKVKASINDFKLGNALLNIPYKDVNPSNQDYTKLFTKCILQEKLEKETLDKRL